MPRMTQKEAERCGLVPKRNKYGAKRVRKCPSCGHPHDSQVEAAFCAHLHEGLRVGTLKHIDIAPVVTLASGTRWKLDFALWQGETERKLNLQPSAEGGARVQFYDVKGYMTRDFKEKRAEFDRLHPGAPLIVVQGKRQRGGWQWTFSRGGR